MKTLNKPQRSVMKHDFAQIPHAEIPRSNFRRSHGLKTTFDSGWLIPIYVDEALPGDTFNVKLSSMARLATPIVPFIDNVHMDFFFFAVPNRLLWNNWQRFMGERDPDPDSSTDFTVPQVLMHGGTGALEGSLWDYFGVPTKITSVPIAAFHSRAYNLIWNEWFRDQNLQDSVVVDVDDGPDTVTDYELLKRGKRHDYFTGCLPWPQKGDAVLLPLGDMARLRTDSNPGSADTQGAYAAGGVPRELLVTGSTITIHTTNVPAQVMYADLEQATAATINSLREAFQLQKLLERDARGGTRYTEIIRSHFRVDSPDARLQRPEYLGGGSTPISITPIAQTSQTATTEQGKLAAIGYHAQSGIGFTKSFVEHSVIIGLVSVRADLTYQQGLNRMFSRSTKYDYYWPALAHLGEQEVMDREIYYQVADTVFGYQERWAEYKYLPSKITGLLRSNATASLDMWHLSQEFGSLPALNASFIEEDPPIARVVAVPTEPEFVFDSYFEITCTRPMPTYSVPGLIDHF